MLNIQELASSRPSADHSIKQFLMSVESLTKQAGSVGSFLANKKVFFLGDDDHLSPILASSYNIQPVVYEIDSRVRNNLKTWYSKLGVKGEVVHYDARFPVDPIPHFDAFYINPPYSSKSLGLGIKVWLMRAIEACEHNTTGVVVMPWNGGNINEKWVEEVQKSVTDFIKANGFQILKVDHNNSSYANTSHADLMSSNIYIQRMDNSKQQLVDASSLYN